MLSKNSIFLKLLGTFYSQLSNSDLINGIDYAYTSIISNRYSDVLNKALGSKDGTSLSNVAQLCFIDVSSVNVVTDTAIVRDIYNQEIVDVSFFAIPYLDSFVIEQTSKTEDGYTLSSSLMQHIAENGTSDKIVILYFSDFKSDYLKSDRIVIPVPMAREDMDFISDSIIKLIQNYLMYKPRTADTLLSIINIMLGALYSSASETVIFIGTDRIITDNNYYPYTLELNGEVLVSEGDILKSGELITSLVTIDTSSTSIGEVEKISAFLASKDLGLSNVMFLKKISTAVSKRIYKINVPSTVLINNSTQTLSSIALISKIMPTKVFSPVSSQMIVDSMTGIEDFELNTYDSAVVYFSEEILFVGSLSEDSIVDLDSGSKESILIIESQDVVMESTDLLARDPILYFDEMISVEKVANIIASHSESIAADEGVMTAVKEDYSFVTYRNEESLLVEDEDLMSADDYDREIKSGIVTLTSDLSVIESDSRNLSWSESASIIMEDVYNCISEAMDNMGVSETYLENGYIVDFLELGISDFVSTGLKEEQEILFDISDPVLSYTQEEEAFVAATESASNIGFNGEYANAIVDELISGPVISTVDILTGTDSMSVGSTVIDEN